MNGLQAHAKLKAQAHTAAVALIIVSQCVCTEP